MIQKALKRKPNINSSEELLNEVYKARQNEKRKSQEVADYSGA